MQCTFECIMQCNAEKPSLNASQRSFVGKCTFALLQWTRHRRSPLFYSDAPSRVQLSAVYHQCSEKAMQCITSVSQVQCINNSAVYDECSGASFGADAVLSWGRILQLLCSTPLFSYHQRRISIFLNFALRKITKSFSRGRILQFLCSTPLFSNHQRRICIF